jgi:hypothetical protein
VEPKEVITVRVLEDKELIEVFCRYVVRKGKRIYPTNARFFHFWVKKKPR